MRSWSVPVAGISPNFGPWPLGGRAGTESGSPSTVPTPLPCWLDEEVVWAFHPTTRNIPNLLRNLRLAWRELRRTKPDIVVSTGAGVALPFFVLARLMRIPTAYVEVYDRIDSATLTGRLCRPFTTLMCVQWEEQRSLYRDTHVIGELL